MVDFNPRGAAEDPRVEALRMAADAHGLANGTHDPLLHHTHHQNGDAVPVITLTAEQANKSELREKVLFSNSVSISIDERHIPCVICYVIKKASSLWEPRKVFN